MRGESAGHSPRRIAPEPLVLPSIRFRSVVREWWNYRNRPASTTFATVTVRPDIGSSSVDPAPSPMGAIDIELPGARVLVEGRVDAETLPWG